MTKTQVTSKQETIWSKVWSSVSTCAQKKVKQQWDIEKRQDLRPPDEVEEFDATCQNARKQQMPCVARVRIPTAKTLSDK